MIPFKAFKASTQAEGEAGQSSWRDKVVTAAALQAMRFPLPQWVIPDLIPEGPDDPGRQTQERQIVDVALHLDRRGRGPGLSR
jgi:hypothetical protein